MCWRSAFGWRLGFASAALVATASVAACGSNAPTRSITSFCNTYNSEKAKYENKYSSLASGSTPQNAGEIVTDLVMGFQSLGDAVIIFDKLDRVAPMNIEPDVAAVRDSLKNIEGTMGDEASNAFNPQGLLGAVFKGVLSSLESGGSWTRVGNYVQRHCQQ
jgi:hypothetical protein